MKKCFRIFSCPLVVVLVGTLQPGAWATDDIIIAAASPDLNGDSVTGDDVVGNITASSFPGAVSVITAAETSNLLGSNNLSLAAAGSVTVNSAVLWSSVRSLTLGGPGGISINTALGHSGASGGITLNGGSLGLGANISSTNGSLTLSGTSITQWGGTLSGSSLSLAHSGTATLNSLSSFTSVSKSGAGTLILSAGSNYSGATTISAGGLRVTNATGSATGTSTVSLASGTTLSGTGIIGGLTTLEAGSIIEPGVDSAGTLTFTNGLTINDGAIFNFELGSSSDLINVTGGTLTGPASSGGATFHFSSASGFGAGTYTLINGIGSSLSGFGATDFTVGTGISGYNLIFGLSGDALILTASAIPEPSTYALIAGLAGLGWVAVRRRRLKRV